jgi:2-polyprenyl-3-methyl-5-hydroxy-6-metoxy-1,4-benzoquinol methylase
MVFANPVPKEFATGDFYDHAGGYYLSDEKLQGDYAPVRFERELKIFRRYCPRGRILDVGCSTGAFLWQLKSRFSADYEILGTDVAGPALDYAEKKGVPIRSGNFLQQSFETPFDAVTFWAVLEHLVEPGPFLQKAAATLKPSGLCFVLVPNFRSLATRILGARYRYILPQHVNYFTVETLSAVASKHFEILEVTTTHFNPLVIMQDFKGKSVDDSQRAGLLKKTTAMKSRKSFAPLRGVYRLTENVLSTMMLADNIVAVLRKRVP